MGGCSLLHKVSCARPVSHTLRLHRDARCALSFLPSSDCMHVISEEGALMSILSHRKCEIVCPVKGKQSQRICKSYTNMKSCYMFPYQPKTAFTCYTDQKSTFTHAQKSHCPKNLSPPPHKKTLPSKSISHSHPKNSRTPKKFIRLNQYCSNRLKSHFSVCCVQRA